jgi:hypothetical protein
MKCVPREEGKDILEEIQQGRLHDYSGVQVYTTTATPPPP